MVVDVTLNHARTKSPATNFIKHLLVITCLVLAAPVLADEKQATLDACYSYFDNSAFPACKKSADQGDPAAQFMLGLMYSNGKGTLKDDKQTVYW